MSLSGYLRRLTCLTVYIIGYSSLAAQTINLAWNPSPTLNVSYALYGYGAVTNRSVVGTNLTATVTYLAAGNWSFNVAAMDTNGVESLLSNTLYVTVPAPPSLMRSVIVQYAGTLDGLNSSSNLFLRLKVP